MFLLKIRKLCIKFVQKNRRKATTPIYCQRIFVRKGDKIPSITCARIPYEKTQTPHTFFLWKGTLRRYFHTTGKYEIFPTLLCFVEKFACFSALSWCGGGKFVFLCLLFSSPLFSIQHFFKQHKYEYTCVFNVFNEQICCKSFYGHFQKVFFPRFLCAFLLFTGKIGLNFELCRQIFD